MLKEAIEERKGDLKAEEKATVEIDLEINAYIPDTYIKDGHQKIEMYKRFRGVESLEDIEELQSEMLDRFGEYPEEVEYLFRVAEMKVYALLAGVESIKQVKQEVAILVNERASSTIDGQKVFAISNKYPRMIGLGMEGQKLKMTLQVKGQNTAQWLNAAFEMIKGLQAAKKTGVSL